MNTLFASNKLLPGMKRRARYPSKQETLSIKSKPLDILPNVSEEEEGRPSSFESTTSFRSFTLGPRVFSKDPAERKRDSRRVVLTGAEGLTFEDFFPVPDTPPRPAPAPPLYQTEKPSESPLDEINLRFSGLGIELDFPSPPADVLSLPNRHRQQSPSPSVSSTVTSGSSSSRSSATGKTPVTPLTSDDESRPHLLRAPTCKSHRASIIYAKSMPDINACVSTGAESYDEVDSDVDSDAEWFARDISDVVTLTSPLPPAFPISDSRTRPDSMLPPPHRGRSRDSKPLPTVPRLSTQATTIAIGRPSAQLDPTFPERRKSFLIPSRPPPPPPIAITRCSAATMERETEELLAQLASAALNSGFLGTGLSPPRPGRLSPTCSVPSSPSSAFVVRPLSRARPLPRMSLPADVLDYSDETPYTPGATAELEVELLPEADLEPEPSTPQLWPASPVSASVYSQPSMSAGSPPLSPASSYSFSIEVPGSALAADSVPERVLRSRWSSSTLGSQFERENASASWMARFHLSPSKRGKGKSPAPTPTSPSKRTSKSPLKRSFELERLERRDSRSSRMSDTHSDSGDSTASSGLRRKPIPVEMFIRA